MFILIKSFNCIVNTVHVCSRKVLFQQYTCQKIVLFYHALRFILLKHATCTIIFTFLLIVLLLSLIQLIRSTNFHPNNTQTQRSSRIDSSFALAINKFPWARFCNALVLFVLYSCTCRVGKSCLISRLFFILALSQDENEMGRFLREQGSQDKSKAGKMMIAVGKAQSYSAQQRYM